VFNPMFIQDQINESCHRDWLNECDDLSKLPRAMWAHLWTRWTH